MKIIIAGCGRLGSELSLGLVQRGHSVTVIDPDPKTFQRLGRRFAGKTIAGIVFDRDVLTSAGIERADGLAAVTSSDNANIVTARIARCIYHVPQVVARLYEPSRSDIYRRLGLQTISTTTWGVGRIAELLTHSRLDSVLEMGSGEVSLVEFEVGPSLAGHTVQDVNAANEIRVVSITRSGKAFIPGSATPFVLADVVHVALLNGTQARFEALVGGK